LAKASGVHRVTIARMETGKISPNIRTLEKLSAALGVKVSELIEKAG
jgi:transcriptional regulator with XRE-family HTH domain